MLPASEQQRRAAALDSSSPSSSSTRWCSRAPTTGATRARCAGSPTTTSCTATASRSPRPDGRPELLLPQNLGQARRGGWGVPMSFARDLRTGLPEALRALGPMRRIGIVGLAQVMKVEDYLALRDAFPDAEIVDARTPSSGVAPTRRPRRSRACASRCAIADACFDRLLEIARIGITEREIGAAMYERCYALGGEDPLFLSMYPEPTEAAASRGASGLPSTACSSAASSSCSRSSSSAAWATGWSSRAWSCSGEPTELQQRMNAAVIAGLDAGAAADAARAAGRTRCSAPSRARSPRTAPTAATGRATASART